jgi:hypothetical protein
MLFNPGDAAVPYTMFFTPSGANGTTTPFASSRALPPRAAPLMTDVVGTIFHLADSAGVIRIVSGGPIRAAARTYDQTDAGTLGQFVPSRSDAEFLRLPAYPAEIIGISENADFRTNLGFYEVRGLPARVEIKVFDAQQYTLASGVLDVPAFGWIQVPLAALVSSGENLRVEVSDSAGTGGATFSYASIVDNRSGDAVFVPSRWEWVALHDEHQVVPVIAGAPGAFGAEWRSDLYAYRPCTSGREPEALLTFHSNRGAKSRIIQPCWPAPGIRDLVDNLFRWSETGNASTVRRAHTATLLRDGRVLVAGGYGYTGNPLSSADVYDPATELWAPVGSMSRARTWHTATLLPTGKVLVAGGFTGSDATQTAELFDPDSGTWSPATNLTKARALHTATALPDGRVVVVGGMNAADPDGSPIAGIEIYDPVTGSWSSRAGMATGRNGHTTTALASGKLLVVGGWTGAEGPTATTALYDPGIDSWSPSGSLAEARSRQTATRLEDGRVLVVGGERGSGMGQALASAELYDPSSGLWTGAGALANERADHSATLLPDGTVLVTGGDDSSLRTLASAETFDLADSKWKPAANMAEPRVQHTATLLPDGRVLIAEGSWRATSSSELFDSLPLFGSLHVESPQGFIIATRTYTPASSGTAGQFIPAFGESDVLRPSEHGSILLVSDTADFRCNVGLSEFSGIDTTVDLLLYDSEGNCLASVGEPVVVPAHRSVQIPLRTLFDLGNWVPAGRLEVEPLDGGSVAAYASVVDNRTSDAIFVPAER